MCEKSVRVGKPPTKTPLGTPGRRSKITVILITDERVVNGMKFTEARKSVNQTNSYVID